MSAVEVDAIRERSMWRPFPRRGRNGSHLYVVLRQKPDTIGTREYHCGATGQRVSQFRSETAAKAVASRLNREASV